MSGLLGLVLGVALIAWAVFVYNRLVNDRNTVAAAWSDIDVQLLRRHDLLPKLVDAVKAYSRYEQSTLATITELRSRSEQAADLPQKARLEAQLEQGVNRLLALAESYPDLKANRNFLDLQGQLSEVEDHLQYARRYYNGAVRIFNTRIESFPQNIVATLFRFHQAEFFDVGEAAVRRRPMVELQ